MKLNDLNATIVLWILLFCLIGFYHSFAFDYWLSQKPAFNSSRADVLPIALILLFVSISTTFLLFVWLIFMIQRVKKSAKKLVHINLIILVFTLIAIFIVYKATNSLSESAVYVGCYSIAFFEVINFYFEGHRISEMK